jgi:localization factor PodJL
VGITRSVARLHKTNPTTKQPIEQGVTPQGNGMAPEPSWQQSNAETGVGAPFSERESVESLLRRLIRRVEESERRYDEALGELDARLDRLSQTPEGSGAAISSEEAETLERLREQLSGLARRHQPAPEPAPDHFAALDKALAEFRAIAAGLAAAEPGVSPLRPTAASEPLTPSPALDFPLPTPAPEPDFSVPSAPPSFSGEGDFEQRLIDMAQRLEHPAGGAVSTAAIETLNARMDELAANFEAALQQSPKLESLHRLERQIGDMAQQIGRAEQHIARIGVIESQLQWLIERVQQAPAEMEGVASKAATDAARLVAEAAAGKPSAAERLEVIHRDLVAMNERGRVTDDRMVDTLEAMHASLKGLAEQLERPEAPLSQGRAALGEPPGPSVSGGAAPVGGDAIGSEEERLDSLRDRLAASDLGFDDDRTNMPFGRAKRSSLGEAAVDFDEMAPARLGTPIAEMSFDSMEDLVAAARRAAQAAAARAEERAAQRPRREDPSHAANRGEPERRTRSFLMVIAALLLIISAALLYSRLQSKPNFGAAPPVAERSTLPPGIGIAPAPSPSP